MAEPGELVATVGLSEPVDPVNAPRPSNEGERLLFRQLYETLLRVDCRGRALPGLATAWQFDESAGRWLLTLREDVRFADGAPLTAADVRASWTRDNLGHELRPDVSHLVDAIESLDDRTLAITLRTSRVDVPLALAHPDLAIARAPAGSRWPIGTRSSRVVTEQERPGAAASAIVVERDGLPPLRFVVSSRDPRDLVDAGVDLLVTRDPAALAYAGTLSRFRSVPLAWQRTHVLLTPGRAGAPAPTPADARQALAKDAVRGEARGAQGPFWWDSTADCGPLPSPTKVQAAPIARLVYDADDAAGRDLAERLIALARTPSEPLLGTLLGGGAQRAYERAAALPGPAFARARRVGRDAGYILSLDNRPLESCRDLRRLLDEAPWLDPAAIVPLVDTRRLALVRLGKSGVVAEWDGGLALAGAGRSSR